jgi:hypothetical protein
VLKQAAIDVRYLVDRSYPKESAVRFVSDHYRLPQEQRFVLMRVVVPASLAGERRAKKLTVNSLSLKGKALFVDGYNVLIAVESLLKGLPVYEGDDGFLRDTEGIFSGYKASEFTVPALSQILDLLSSAAPSNVEVIFDQQISMSGRLAGLVREMMVKHGVPGTARTARDVDHQLKLAEGIIATGDGNVIDAVSCVADIPGQIALKMGICPVSL